MDCINSINMVIKPLSKDKIDANTPEKDCVVVFNAHILTLPFIGTDGKLYSTLEEVQSTEVGKKSCKLISSKK